MTRFSKMFVLALICFTATTGAFAQLTQQLYVKDDLLRFTGPQTFPTNVLNLATNPVSFPLKPGQGVAIFPYLVGSGAGTSNIVFTLAISPGLFTNQSLYGQSIPIGTTNFTTLPVNTNLQYTVALNGTTPVLGYFYIPATNLFGASKITLSTVGSSSLNSGTSYTVSNIWISTVTQQ